MFISVSSRQKSAGSLIRYQLVEHRSAPYQARTEANVIDSHPTVVFTFGAPAGGSNKTVAFAEKHQRRAFRQFYAVASVAEEWALDALVIAHAALVIGLNTPRQSLAADERNELERATMTAEQEFSRMRDIVRSCPTYQRVSEGERWALETSLCQMKVPEAGS